jgi:O-antigen/teichoic acid export membrane protein
MEEKPSPTKQIQPQQNWKLIAKLLGSIVFIIVSVIALAISPGFGVALFIWGIIWFFQSIVELIKKFKRSKVYPALKKLITKTLVILLICAVIVMLFNFIAGLSATTFIIILLILILLK